MDILLPFHIVAGSLGLASGYVALFAAKGAPVHRRAGVVFVAVMLGMALSGAAIAVTRQEVPALNVPAGLMTAYLVFTGMATVRPSIGGSRALTIGAMLVALGVGVTALALGFDAVSRGGTREGMPAFPFFLFGVIGVCGAVGDVRAMRAGTLRGPSRITRHLWRMCTALIIAALSFFIGQADVIPKPIRIRPLLALPMLVVLATMLYWIWRVRVRRTFRGSLRSAPGAATVETT